MGVTKEEIWRRAKLRREKVEGSSCFERVYVRGMMLDEFTEWNAWCEAHTERDIAHRIVLDFCVDDAGAPIFAEEDRERIGTLPPDAFIAAAAAFNKVNKAAADDAETAAKKGKRRRRTSSSSLPDTSAKRLPGSKRT
jgi:hypothetical protein